MKDSHLNKKLAIYYTAGYPQLEDTIPIALALQQEGVDLIEIGMPYSDPIADGTTIQKSSEAALKNGMTLDVLFQQLHDLPSDFRVPVYLMGYFNQVLQYGVEEFLMQCKNGRISGVILPDLPPDVFEREYETLFNQYNINISFLVTPETSLKRMQYLDELSSGFLYVVSGSSTTGSTVHFTHSQLQYLQRIATSCLNAQRWVGFGINSATTFKQVTQYLEGAIVGSAFLHAIEKGDLNTNIQSFIQQLRP